MNQIRTAQAVYCISNNSLMLRAHNLDAGGTSLVDLFLMRFGLAVRRHESLLIEAAVTTTVACQPLESSQTGVER